MCGRFVSSSSPDKIAEFFGADVAVDTLGANYNVAPTQDIYGVTADGADNRSLQAYRWGLLPIWAKDVRAGARMINARAETLASKPAFKGVFRKHRCIIPMDGFYEWAPAAEGGPVTKAGKPAKRPYYIHRTDGQPLAVAGLWSAWRDPADISESGQEPETAGEWLHTASVITTSANATMKPIHDRMPVILPMDAWDEWLDASNDDLVRLSSLLMPADDDVLTMHRVSTDVGNVRNRGADLVEPVDVDAGA